MWLVVNKVVNYNLLEKVTKVLKNAMLIFNDDTVFPTDLILFKDLFISMKILEKGILYKSMNSNLHFC